MFQVTRLFKLITNYATQKFVTDIGSALTVQLVSSLTGLDTADLI